MDTSLLKAMAQTRRFSLGHPVETKVTPDGKAVLFLRAGSRTPRQTLFEMALPGGEAKEILTPDALLGGKTEELSAEEKARRERMRVGGTGFVAFGLDPAGEQVLVSLSGRPYVYNRSTRKAAALPVGAGAAVDARFSPDGKRVAYVRDFNLYVTSLGGAEVALTKGGTEAKPFGLAEFVAQEELDRREGYWWSPDSATLLYQATDQSAVERLTLTDPANPGREPYRPFYPRPGKANAEVRLGLVSAKGGATTWVEWDRARYPYVGHVTWTEGAPPTVLVLDRLQQRAAVLAVDARSGKTRVLHEERDEAWVNLFPGGLRWVDGGAAFLWATERDGDWALELHNAKDGATKTILPAGAGPRAVVHVDGAKRNVYFVGGPEPTEGELYRVSLDGGAPVSVLKAPGGGLVNARFGKGAPAFVAHVAPRTGPARTVVVSMEGKELAVVPSVAETPPMEPQVELTRAGKDDLRVAIVRPRSFIKGRKYPVIDSAYGGPHSVRVEAPATGYLKAQWLADAADAVVVVIDAKGTPRRGRAFERAIGKRFGEVPVEGHVEALKALGERYPELDLARVGVVGWSYGGFFSAYALLARPDVYKVAVAGAPPVDWRDYDTAYTERYLGLPDGDAGAKVYDESSPLRFLTGQTPVPEHRKLLVVHGTADDNVFFSNSLRLIDALDRAGYPYRFMPLMGQTHMVTDPALIEAESRQTVEFFRQHL